MLSRTTGSIYLQKNTVLPLHLSTCTCTYTSNLISIPTPTRQAYINIYKTYIMYIQLSQASDDHTLLDTETIPCCIKYFFHFLYKHRNIQPNSVRVKFFVDIFCFSLSGIWTYIVDSLSIMTNHLACRVKSHRRKIK